MFKKTFESDIARELLLYFDKSTNITFQVQSISNVTALHSTDKSEQNKPRDSSIAFYCILTVTGLIAFIGIVALLFNEQLIPAVGPCNIVDNARWTAVVTLSLQVYDFGTLMIVLLVSVHFMIVMRVFVVLASDIRVAMEIWTHPDLSTKPLIMVSGLGSIVFVAVPYFTNLYMVCNYYACQVLQPCPFSQASRIKSKIKGNDAAKTWFVHNSAIFVAFVVLTGGCFSSLALVSSGIFGLEILDAGLTRHELRNMLNLKVFGTVILGVYCIIMCLCHILTLARRFGAVQKMLRSFA